MSCGTYAPKDNQILTKLIILVYNKTNIISLREGTKYGAQRTESGRCGKGSGGAD